MLCYVLYDGDNSNKHSRNRKSWDYETSKKWISKTNTFEQCYTHKIIFKISNR